ncbi:MAG: class I adenylate-forming enzyme family protein [Candidatus Omnitrophota bacterium]|nr:class I adenylate-forming enzyme family protein [Candidatus Omnitrophota bacterium]
MNLGTSLHWVSTKMKDKACLIEGAIEVSYSELWKNIETLAKGFLKIGIKENDKAVIILPNCKEFIYSFYGLARINAISVPLNTYLTSYELDKIFKDCDPKVIITTYQLYKKKISAISNKNILIILTDESLEPGKDGLFELGDLLAKGGTGRLPRFSANNNQIATINYTYRGLGEAIGAVLTHGNYHHGAIGYLRLTKLVTTQRVLLITPMSHIFTLVSCVIVPLLRGATVVIMKSFIPSHIFKAIEDHKIDFVIAVPTIYISLLKNYKKGRFDISSLKYGITGGSYLSESLNKEIKEEMGIELLQGYGLTETMPIMCNPHSRNKMGSLGVAGHEVKVKIVDGEILIGGPTVMRGYYNKNGENKKYLKDGWFKTGDMGYIDEEGYVYFKGLKKDIIKVGGNNVDLTEVKNVLNSFPGARNVRLDIVGDELWGHRIHAEITGPFKKEVTDKDVKAFCSERMALYKIPKRILIRMSRG